MKKCSLSSHSTCVASLLDIIPVNINCQMTFINAELSSDCHMQDPFPERSLESINLMESMFLWLLRYGAKQDVAAEQKLVNERQASVQPQNESSSSPQKGSPSKAEGRAEPSSPGSITGVGISSFTGADPQPQVLVSELWLSVLQAFTRVSLEPNEHLRNHAVVILHR